MATIAQNLQKIIDSKAAIKTSINNKGGSITDSTPLDEYSTAIDNLPSGGGGDYIVSTETGTVTQYIEGVDAYIKELKLGTISNNSKLFISTGITSAGSTISNKDTGTATNVCSNVEKISWSGNLPFSNSKYICKYAFYFLKNLKTLNGTLAPKGFGESALAFTFSLSSLSIDTSACNEIRSRAFMGCGLYEWQNDSSKRGLLGDIAFNNLTVTLDTYAFAFSNFNTLKVNTPGCSTYSLAILGSTVTVGSSCTTFHCMALETSTLTGYDSTGSWFSLPNSCHVTTLIMEATTPPSMSGGSIGSTTINSLAHIYVPASAVSAYKTATGWSGVANIIEANPN